MVLEFVESGKWHPVFQQVVGEVFDGVSVLKGRSAYLREIDRRYHHQRWCGWKGVRPGRQRSRCSTTADMETIGPAGQAGGNIAAIEPGNRASEKPVRFPVRQGIECLLACWGRDAVATAVDPRGSAARCGQLRQWLRAPRLPGWCRRLWNRGQWRYRRAISIRGDSGCLQGVVPDGPNQGKQPPLGSHMCADI